MLDSFTIHHITYIIVQGSVVCACVCVCLGVTDWTCYTVPFLVQIPFDYSPSSYRFPFSQNDTQYAFNIPCIGTFGGDIDPNVALGGFKGS